MHSLVVSVGDESAIGEARRGCAALSITAGLDEHTAGRVAIVAVEIASNLLKHGTRMQRVVASTIEQDGASGVEILGIDAGTGIANIADALRDGHSTAGSSGTGLGGVKRMSDVFELYSVRDSGTIILSRVFARHGEAERAPSVEIGTIVAPLPGEIESGDAASVKRDGDRRWILMADGLGHGPDAALAAAIAVRAFHDVGKASPALHMSALHEALRPTRGAAVAIAEIRMSTREIVFAGVGNIAASITTPTETRSMVSHDGIAGHMMRRVQEFTYPFPSGALFVMHSDGLTQRWDLASYPGLTMRHPSIIAGVLYRDASRGRDDAAVVVVRDRHAAPG